MKKSLLFSSFFVLIMLFVLHLVGIKFYFYWDSRWFDNTAHFLGGLGVGLLSLWILFVSGIFGKHKPNKKQILFASIACGMIIGAGWEVFEFVNKIANPIGSYKIDTAWDLFADFVGALTAGFVGRNRKYYE